MGETVLRDKTSMTVNGCDCTQMRFGAPVRVLAASLFCFTFCLRADAPCASVPAFSPCEIPFELTEPEFTTHPNPYKTVELRAEFRSPRHRTFLIPAFWDGGKRLIIRFAPTEAGAWDYRT